MLRTAQQIVELVLATLAKTVKKNIPTWLSGWHFEVV
jgi:hypothetical protein